MMIKELIKPMLYFLLFAILLNSCSIGKIVSKRTQTKLINSTLNHEQINDDINYFLANIEAIAPNPYIFGHKTKIDSIANEIKSCQALEPIEFYEKLQVLIGSFNIPHLYSYFPVEYLKNNIKKDGGFIEHSTKIKQPGSNDLRYEGPVYVVINNGVFSSANMMANAIEDFDLATIVGQPSGAVVNELGEILAVRLPNSGISCWIPSAMFIRANGDRSNPNPVLPCIWIEQEKLNTIKMEELVKIIENSKN